MPALIGLVQIHPVWMFSAERFTQRELIEYCLLRKHSELIVGVTLGVVCGFRSNLATEFIARIADLVQSFPVFITAMILVALAENMGQHHFCNVAPLCADLSSADSHRSPEGEGERVHRGKYGNG